MIYKDFKVYVLYLVGDDLKSELNVGEYPSFKMAQDAAKEKFPDRKIRIKEFKGDRLDLYFEQKLKKAKNEG